MDRIVQFTDVESLIVLRDSVKGINHKEEYHE